MPCATEDGRPLEFEDAEGDPVDVEHDVGALGVVPLDRNLFRDGEVVRARVLPIDQVDGDPVLAEPRAEVRSVAQEAVHLAVGVVERLATAESSGLAEFLQRFGDDGRLVFLAGEELPEEVFLDVPIVRSLVPVAQIPVPELIPEVLDDPALGADLAFADGAHRRTLPRSFRPISRTPARPLASPQTQCR